VPQLLKRAGTATLAASRASMFHTRSLPSMTPPKGFRWLGVLLRVVAVVIALQMSGALHAAADALMSCAGLVAGGDCDDEADGQQCPPGCPNCHCPARSNVAPPEAFDVSSLLTLSEGQRLAPVFRDDTGPQGPDRSPLYRPPRAASLA
jgi:hypothetical protein